MELLQILDILKGHQTVSIERNIMKTDAKTGKTKSEKETIYSGKVIDFNPKLNEIRGLYVEMVYCGYYDTISITLK
ncbi:MAG: hypothetical protein ACLUPZ_03380 [Lachnospiraceae bacterium]